MKKQFLFVLTALAILAGGGACDDPKGSDDTEIGPKKTVAVAAQEGSVTTGFEGSVTFAVTTENIAEGDYAVTLEGVVDGITVGNAQGEIAIDAQGEGQLTLDIATTAAAGDNANAKITIDGAKSAAFTVTVAAAEKSVAVGIQNGVINKTLVGQEAAFEVTTVDIPADTYTVTVQNKPAGISVKNDQVVIGANGKGTLTLVGSATTVEAVNSTLTLTLDSTVSDAFTLKVSGDQAFTVGAQTGSVVAGAAGTLRFAVSGTNMPDGAAFSVVKWWTALTNGDETSAATGITPALDGMQDNMAEITVTVATTASAGDFFCEVKIGTATKRFKITVNAPPAEEDFYGKWKHATGITVTISETSIIVANEQDTYDAGGYKPFSYTISEIASWTFVTKTHATYINGYKIVGVLSALADNADRDARFKKQGTTDDAAENDTVEDYWYINAAKDKLHWVGPGKWTSGTNVTGLTKVVE